MTFDLPDATAVLARTPDALRALLLGLPPAWTGARERPDGWSPHDVVAHLVHADRTVWLPRARTILEHGRAIPFPPFDRAGHARDRPDRPLAELLDAFADARAASLATLAGWRLDAAALAREGEHPEFGTVTLAQLVAAWMTHDLGHLAQIARVMARQYRDAVGPWRAYLSILDP